MKPVAIFRHAPTEGPGYFATFLDGRNIPWELIKLDAGMAVPANPGDFSGLVFMGGPMSVNDDLPWIAPVLQLIRSAVASGVPVMGHCLGSQLMSKALDGTVGRNPTKEIGWGDVRILDNPVAREWFGDTSSRFSAFHWHGETFTIPQGAVRILESDYCTNQAFVLGDKHLGMQCHVEMTADMVETWCRNGADEIAGSPGPAVQSAEVMQKDMKPRLDALNRVAATLYTRWVQGLAS